jgi:hypothetical protein
MALYSIIRVYEVPAENRIEATNRMLEAILLKTTGDYHVKDLIRDPDAKPGKGVQVSLKPPSGWLSLLLRQLTGSPR